MHIFICFVHHHQYMRFLYWSFGHAGWRFSRTLGRVRYCFCSCLWLDTRVRINMLNTLDFEYARGMNVQMDESVNVFYLKCNGIQTLFCIVSSVYNSEGFQWFDRRMWSVDLKILPWTVFNIKIGFSVHSFRLRALLLLLFRFHFILYFEYVVVAFYCVFHVFHRLNASYLYGNQLTVDHYTTKNAFLLNIFVCSVNVRQLSRGWWFSTFWIGCLWTILNVRWNRLPHKVQTDGQNIKSRYWCQSFFHFGEQRWDSN